MEKEVEEKRLLSIIRRMDLPFSSSFKVMKTMKIAKTVDHAWRLWMRSRAKGMINYDTKVVQRNRGGFYVPSDWNWERPFNEWNVIGSLSNFPPFPFPPFSRGTKEFKGFRGSSTIPEVRDLLIVRDSSGSMRPFARAMEEELANFKNAIMDSDENENILVARANFNSRLDIGGYVKIDDFNLDYKPGGATILYDTIIEGID